VTPDPRTALVVSLLAGLAGLASARGASFAIVGLVLWASLRGVPPLRLLRRALPIVSGLLAVLVLVPFAPARVLGVALRGFAVSLAPVVLGCLVSWSGLIAALQGFGLSRPGVAFLVILARHTVTVGEEARRASRALVVRGGFSRAGNLVSSTAILVARVMDVALHRAEHVAQALTLRGFEGRVPGLLSWRPRRAEAGDYLMALVLGAVAVAEVVPWHR
jgi:energy-coupling factor transporter transmembrane protein EcfT